MKKKMFACLLGMILVLTAAGCGAQTPDSSEAPVSSAVESSAASIESTEAAASAESAEQPEESKPAEIEAEGLKPLMLAENRLYGYYYEDSAPNWYGALDIETPVVLNGTKELSASLASLAKEKEETAAWFQGFIDQAVEEDWLKEEYLDWSESVFSTIVRADSKYLSFWLTDDAFLGGAHPSSYLTGYTYDAQTGRRLELKDIVTDYARLQEIVLEQLESDEDDFFDNWRESVNSYFEEGSLSWTISAERLSILFNTYSIAAYAYGNYSVDLYFEDYEGLFAEDILPAKGNDRLLKTLYAYENDDKGFSYDFDGDGHPEKLTLFSEAEYYEGDGYSYPISVDVTIGLGRSSSSMKYVTNSSMDGATAAYVCETKGGRYYLLVDYAEENGWHSLVTYDLNDPDKGPAQLGYCQFGGLGGVKVQNADDFFVTGRIHIMGTFSTYTEVYLDEDGTVRAFDETVTMIRPYYNTDYTDPGEAYPYNRFGNKVVTDFDAKEHGTGKTVHVKAGEILYAYATDGETYMTFQKKDGSLIDVYYDGYDEENWANTINGISEFEIFDEVIYAG